MELVGRRPEMRIFGPVMIDLVSTLNLFFSFAVGTDARLIDEEDD